MMEYLVSVIVPVYNVEEYLEECVDSILKQTYKRLEIILVDDGSTDGCPEICDVYAEKDMRVKVIHQQNAGAANARKRGIMAATAEYVCFVDADDTVDAGMIQFFIGNIGNADLLTSGCKCEKANGAYLERYDSFEKGIFKTKKEMEYFISNMIVFNNRMIDGVLPYLFNKLYRKSIMEDAIKGIDERIRYAEDRELLFRYLLRCSSVVVTKENFYYYRYRSSSAVNAPNEYFLHDLNYFYNSLKSEFLLYELRDSLMKQLQRFVMSRTLMATKFMGFVQEAQCIRYVFPFNNMLNGQRVILYGAGVVGTDYYRQTKAECNFEIVLWVDKNWKKYQDVCWKIKPVEKVLDVIYDVIIIAVKKETLASCIIDELNRIGVPKEKMMWKEPLDILI